MVLRLFPGESRFFANLAPLHLCYGIAILKPIWEKPKCIKNNNLRCGLVGLFASVGWLIFNKPGSVSSATAGCFWVGNHGKVAQVPMRLAHAAVVSGYPLSFCLFTLIFYLIPW